jgi:hypothetical protein
MAARFATRYRYDGYIIPAKCSRRRLSPRRDNPLAKRDLERGCCAAWQIENDERGKA